MLLSKLHLDPGEKIVYEVRRHWFVFLFNGIVLALLALLPFLAYSFLSNYLNVIPADTIEKYFYTGLFFYALWLLFLWMMFFLQWTKYYLDVWYITDKRIIDVDQKAIFHREVSNLRFDKIQDISIEVHGVIATFLNFGNLQVQTAAEDSSDFFMKHARKPEEVRRIIFSQHNIESEKKRNPS